MSAELRRKRDASCSPPGASETKSSREKSPISLPHTVAVPTNNMQSNTPVVAASTPVSTKSTSPKNFFSKFLKAKSEITIESLYNALMDQESRLSTMEKKVEDLESENTGLKEKLAGLEQVKLDLATASDGVASLEKFKDEIETRLNTLEQQGTQIEDSVTSPNTADAATRVSKIQHDLDDHISKMRDFKLNLKKENRRRHLEWEQQEQYSRRDCVMVKGVPYKRDENTTDIVCQIANFIGVGISPSDISTSHRTGRQVGSTPRPIIVKFTRRDTKYWLMSRKTEARHIKTDPEGKQCRIFIDENLTQMRARVCKKLRDDKILHKVKDGKIHILTTGENPTTEKILDSPHDWEGLDWPDNVKIELGIYPKD